MHVEVLSALSKVGSAPLAGRDMECTLLLERVRAAHQSGAVLVISGEPGAGKTRLASEIASRAAEEGCYTFALRCYEQTRTLPYAPFRNLTVRLDALIPAPPDVPGEADAHTFDGTRLGFFEHVDRWFIDSAGDATLLLLVDDAQWADAATLDLLRHLARCGRRGRRALLLTVRADERDAGSAIGALLADLGRETSLLDLPLSPLSKVTCAELLLASLGPFDDTLLDIIYDRTGGNPFFVEECLRFLLAEGYLTRHEGIWHLKRTEGNGHFPTPPAVSVATLRRLARLPEVTQAALRSASVFGSRIAAPLLATLLGQPVSALVDDLAPAVEARLLRFEDATDSLDAEYAFLHALTRDAIYTELPPVERREWHRRAALALERMMSDASLAHLAPPALLAYHAERAREWHRAYQASLAAGDAALRAMAGHDALQHFTRAREFAWTLLPDGLLAERMPLDRRIVAALLAIGHMNEAATEAQFLATRAQEAGDRWTEAWASVRLGQAQTFAHHLDRAEVALTYGRTLAESLGDDALLATALSETSVLLDKFGRLDEAGEYMRRALPLAEHVGDRAIAVNGLNYLGYAATWRGQFDTGVEHFREAKRLAEATRDVMALALAQFGLGLAYAARGEYTAALAELHALLSFSDTTGEPYYAVRAPNTIGWIYRELALLDRALEWDQRAVAESAEGDWPGLFEARANSLLNLASDLTLLGRLDETEDVLRRAAEAIDADEFMRWRTSNRLLLCRGEVALARYYYTEAVTYAQNALDHAIDRSSQKYVALAHDLMGRIHLAQSHYQEASVSLETALQIATDIQYHAGIWRTAYILAAAYDHQQREAAAARKRALADEAIAAIAAKLHDADLAADFIAHAHRFARNQPTAPSSKRSTGILPRPRPAGLSPREVEVLSLVAEGCTNHEIARQLIISDRTVNTHLVRIFNKLGVNNRAAAAAFAVQHGIGRLEHVE